MIVALARLLAVAASLSACHLELRPAPSFGLDAPAPAEARLTGKLLDPCGQPVAHGTVHAVGADGVVRLIETDAGGGFELRMAGTAAGRVALTGHGRGTAGQAVETPRIAAVAIVAGEQRSVALHAEWTRTPPPCR